MLTIAVPELDLLFLCVFPPPQFLSKQTYPFFFFLFFAVNLSLARPLLTFQFVRRIGQRNRHHAARLRDWLLHSFLPLQ